MRVLSTVVTDIRPRSRETLVRRLRENGRFAIAGVFSTWAAGLEAVRRREPHVAFLPMPEPADASLAGVLAGPDAPSLVLMGTRPEEATRAFDLGAMDYLVRPPTADRVDRTLRYLCGELPDAGAEPRPSLVRPEWWPFRDSDGEFLLPLSDVRRLEATRGGTTVHTTVRPHHASIPFEQLVGALSRQGFVRVNPGELVRSDVVRELRQITPDTWDLLLEGGDRVRSSPSERVHVESLMEALGDLAIH